MFYLGSAIAGKHKPHRHAHHKPITYTLFIGIQSVIRKSPTARPTDGSAGLSHLSHISTPPYTSATSTTIETCTSWTIRSPNKISHQTMLHFCMKAQTKLPQQTQLADHQHLTQYSRSARLETVVVCCLARTSHILARSKRRPAMREARVCVCSTSWAASSSATSLRIRILFASW